MKRIGRVRSALPPHGRHAITTGTNYSGGGERIVTPRQPEFVRAEINKNGVLRA
jgi:hypothetical protein